MFIAIIGERNLMGPSSCCWISFFLDLSVHLSFPMTRSYIGLDNYRCVQRSERLIQRMIVNRSTSEVVVNKGL